MSADRAEAIAGKTIRFIWTQGPTKGKTHEHVFRTDGTVIWRDPGGAADAQAPESPKYAAYPIADDVYLVSYLSSSGYTLTVALNLREKTIVGFASGAKDWYPIEGTLEVMP